MQAKKVRRDGLGNVSWSISMDVSFFFEKKKERKNWIQRHRNGLLHETSYMGMNRQQGFRSLTLLRVEHWRCELYLPRRL